MPDQKEKGKSPAGSTTASPTRAERGGKTHSHKSKKMTTATLNEIMKADPRSLPSIATDPFAQFKSVAKVSPFEHHSPYALGSGISAQSSMKHLQSLTSDEKKTLDLLIAPSPPKSSSPGKSNPRHSPSSQQQEQEEEDNKEDADEQHGDSAAENEDEETAAAPKKADPDAPNELTLTYLKILQKSEDYNRRTIKESEHKNIIHTHKNWVKFGAMVRQFTEMFEAIEFQQEEKKREEIATDEEIPARHKIVKQCDASYQVAKRHEDIKPVCPLIARGKTVHLDPHLVNGMLAEFRWRGNIEAVLNILVFDENEKLCGVASTTELVKGTDQAVAIRKFSEQGNGLSIGGSLVSFQVILANLTFRMKRVLFCLVNRDPKSDLDRLSRAWLTLRCPPDGESLTHNTKVTKEVFACSVREAGPVGGLVVGSIVRRGTTNTWIFGCENETFLWANTAQRLSVHLTQTFLHGLHGIELEAQASYERVAYQYICSFWEDIFRKLIMLEFEEALGFIRQDLNAHISRDEAAQEKARRRASMRFKASVLDKMAN